MEYFYFFHPSCSCVSGVAAVFCLSMVVINSLWNFLQGRELSNSTATRLYSLIFPVVHGMAHSPKKAELSLQNFCDELHHAKREPMIHDGMPLKSPCGGGPVESGPGQRSCGWFFGDGPCEGSPGGRFPVRGGFVVDLLSLVPMMSVLWLGPCEGW